MDTLCSNNFVSILIGWLTAPRMLIKRRCQGSRVAKGDCFTSRFSNFSGFACGRVLAAIHVVDTV